MLRPRCEHFDALFFRTPLQNIDIHLAHAPAFHFQTRRLVKINRIGTDQSGAVVINHVLLGSLDDFEAGSEREARPVRSSAPNNSARKIFADRVASSAAAPLVDTIRRRAHVHAMRFRAVTVRRWLGRATCEKCTYETCERKAQ